MIGGLDRAADVVPVIIEAEELIEAHRPAPPPNAFGQILLASVPTAVRLRRAILPRRGDAPLGRVYRP